MWYLNCIDPQMPFDRHPSIMPPGGSTKIYPRDRNTWYERPSLATIAHMQGYRGGKIPKAIKKSTRG